MSDQALPQVSVEWLSKSAVLPAGGTIGSASMDLCAATSINIPAGGQVLVPMDLAFALPGGLYMQLASRSALAARHRVQVIGGVIDKDYRGNVKINLANLGSSNFPVKCSDRIAKMLVLPTPDFGFGGSGYFAIHTKVHIGFWEYRSGFSKGYYKQCHRGTSSL